MCQNLIWFCFGDETRQIPSACARKKQTPKTALVATARGTIKLKHTNNNETTTATKKQKPVNKRLQSIVETATTTHTHTAALRFYMSTSLSSVFLTASREHDTAATISASLTGRSALSTNSLIVGRCCSSVISQRQKKVKSIF